METLSVADLLAAFGRTSASEHTVPADGTLHEAIEAIVTRRIPIVIAEHAGSFVGVVTARDILRSVHEFEGEGDPLAQTVRSISTPASKVVTAAPDDSLSQVSIIMSEARVRSLPVVSTSAGGKAELAGVVTLKDVSDFVNMPDTGAKESFSKNILGRRGLGSGATMRLGRTAQQSGASGDDTAGRCTGESSVPTLPATASGEWIQLRTGAACEARQVKPPQPPPPIEDAHFVARVSWPADGEACLTDSRQGGNPRGTADGGGAVAPVTYFGVLDGVGSWAGRGVDPTAFSAALRDAAVDCVSRAPAGLFAGVGRSAARPGDRFTPSQPALGPPSPLDVLAAAWRNTLATRVVGSTTALFASLDPLTGHLAVANVGDCGVLVVRPLLEGAGGSMVSGATAPGDDDLPPLAVAYRSAQQLHDFNFPFQLGYAPGSDEDGEESSGLHDSHFENPTHADFTRVPILPGDIVIAATDGLFDNVDSDGILLVVARWVHEGGVERARAASGPTDGGVALDPETLRRGDNDPMRGLAQALVKEAVTRSMDKTRDSPFATLAKDNDIMWSGGIPDDVAVVVGLVTEEPWRQRQ
ncbi:hypothetical protein FNF31_01465 [Cafeteria roenbergensis]|uniref:Protein phosphatase n=1 Tax=Cafeteria roenbergensis TaxID=33653 RepID=A0A5A8DM59_CAFRO|nr:hypothetical protein FNF31_01465 [Cafeteria roenbergensis]KAA0169550.1 hypothetical protein FNF28_01995 [Cafeteria roenbergensis]